MVANIYVLMEEGVQLVIGKPNFKKNPKIKTK